MISMHISAFPVLRFKNRQLCLVSAAMCVNVGVVYTHICSGEGRVQDVICLQDVASHAYTCMPESSHPSHRLLTKLYRDKLLSV